PSTFNDKGKQPEIISSINNKYDENESFDTSENFLEPKSPNINNIINFKRENDTLYSLLTMPVKIFFQIDQLKKD
ncbi:683_t:CDS:1, partial [Funneliformis geosporum]